MELDFNTCDKTLNKYRAIYKSLIFKTLKHLKLSFEPIVSVSFVGNDYIHDINRKYRDIDRPTDVISFAFLDGEDRNQIYKSSGPICLGDIYVSVDKAKEQAMEYGHDLDRELKFLFIHGLLHLLGYDHMRPEDEKVMFKLQDEIIGERK